MLVNLAPGHYIPHYRVTQSPRECWTENEVVCCIFRPAFGVRSTQQQLCPPHLLYHVEKFERDLH